MARMIPFPMLPTDSTAERRLYEGFMTQLGGEYVVYHSVDWVLAGERPGDPPELGEADFVIAHPVHGVLVIEAKGGELSYDPATRRWSQSGRSGRHFLDEDPFHQALDELHSLVEILKGQPGWNLWRPSYGHAIAVPDSRFTKDAHPGAPARLAIDHDDTDRLDRRVPEIMRSWRRAGRRFGAEGMEALERALGFRVEMRVPLRLQFQEEDRRIFELTDEQAYVLAFVKKRRRATVIGPAGSGKTVLATALAKALATGGVSTLLTCFNWRLGAHLRDSLAGVAHLEVMHFHELCRHLGKTAGLDIPPPPPEEAPDPAYYEEVLPAVLGRATEALGPRYDAVLVDEAQDFRASWWPLLLALHRDSDHGYLFLFADSSQNIYGGSVPRPPDAAEVPLPSNLRNTQPINEFVSVFHEGEIAPVGRGPQGRPVEVLAYEDPEDLARLLPVVLKNLQAEDVSLDDVVVLTPVAGSKSALRAMGEVDGFRFAEEPEPGTVLIGTIQGFKGLERPVVVLAELDERSQDRLAQLLYVGGSRARNHLIVLATEPVAKEVRALTKATGP
jgi:hypothetical protein